VTLLRLLLKNQSQAAEGAIIVEGREKREHFRKKGIRDNVLDLNTVTRKMRRVTRKWTDMEVMNTVTRIKRITTQK
jgi:hypothetical protein